MRIESLTSRSEGTIAAVIVLDSGRTVDAPRRSASPFGAPMSVRSRYGWWPRRSLFFAPRVVSSFHQAFTPVSPSAA